MLNVSDMRGEDIEAGRMPPAEDLSQMLAENA
jgi:hypothetical protein